MKQQAITLPGLDQATYEQIASDIEKFIRSQRCAATGAVYEREIRLFFEFAVSHPEKDAEQSALSYVEHLAAGRECSTIARKIFILSAFFEFLKDRGRIALNPFRIIKPPRVPNVGKTYCPTREELEKLLGAPDKNSYCGLRDYLILYLMAYLGLRVSEARRLTTQNVRVQGDGERKIRFIGLKTKGGKERKIPISDFLFESISRLIEMKIDFVATPDNFYLFTRRIGANSPMSSFAVELMVKRFSSNPDISPHSLRVYFINEVRRRTGDVEKARRLAGHESILTTQRYFREKDDLAVLPEDLVRQ